jgi:hypothetical protein
MTKKEAKAVMMEVWGYFAAHPECGYKKGMPPELYDKVKHCLGRCPLCEVFWNSDAGCRSCILFKADAWCYSTVSSFYKWLSAPKGEAGNAIRAASAKKIFDISEAWDTEEE